MCEKAHLLETVHTGVLEVTLLLYINIYHRHSPKKENLAQLIPCHFFYDLR